MSRNAYRDEDDTDKSDSYWRRRVITLAAGLSLLGVLAWAFSGGGGKPANPSPRSLPAAAYSRALASSSSSAGQAGSAGSAGSAQAIPGLPSASPTPGSGSRSRSGSGSGRAAASASASGNSRTRQSAPGKPGATGTAPAAAPASGPGPDGACSPSAVVLSLFTRSEYYGGQYPQFDVDVVSTAARACSFDVGPSHLHVVVMSAGRVIWDSADCTRGETNRSADLRRGVPAQEAVSWNRSITLPGCVTLASSARLGSYEVQAKSATVSSPVRTFKLAHLSLTDA